MLRAAHRVPLCAALLSALLASVLLTPAAAYAAQPTTTLPCSDHEQGFPSCGISTADVDKANALYDQAQKLLRSGQFDAALEKVRAARSISPADIFFATAEQLIQHQAANAQVRLGDQAMQIGDTTAALTAFRRALELDPGNGYAEERLHAALPPVQTAVPVLTSGTGELRLEPQPVRHSFHFRGSSPVALQQFSALFGINAVADASLTARNVRIELDDVDWKTGSQILEKLCKVLLIPISEREVLVANDTEENRRELVTMSMQTFYLEGGYHAAAAHQFDHRFARPLRAAIHHSESARKTPSPSARPSPPSMPSPAFSTTCARSLRA